jgi:hypothetical protein
MWKAIFRKDPPPSGEVVEKHFEADAADSGEWRWIEFESSDGDIWCARIRSGRIDVFNAIAWADERHAFILAGGVWYCIDAQTKDLRSQSTRGFFSGILPIPGSSRVAIADLSAVTIATPTDILWITPRIAWDGVRLVSSSPTEVVGIAETGHGREGDREFRIDLTSRAVRGGYVEDFQKW